MFSDEAVYCMECVTKHDPKMIRYDLTGKLVEALASTMRGEARAEATIGDLGKFEGEPLSTYHAYHVMTEGGQDEDHGSAWLVGNMICEESDSGFVGADIYKDDAEALATWERLESIDYVEQYS